MSSIFNNLGLLPGLLAGGGANLSGVATGLPSSTVSEGEKFSATMEGLARHVAQIQKGFAKHPLFGAEVRRVAESRVESSTVFPEGIVRDNWLRSASICFEHRVETRLDSMGESRFGGSAAQTRHGESVIGDIEEIFQNGGIKTKEEDDLFWKLGCQVSPFMRAMRSILKEAPSTLQILYPAAETDDGEEGERESIGYCKRDGGGLLNRVEEWGKEIALAHVSPVVSVHERIHAIPWRRLCENTERENSTFPALLPKMELPEIDAGDDILDIALKLIQRMFLDEACASLGEIFVAQDLVMAGLDPLLIPEYVWEEKRVFDAGGLSPFIASRLYLGDNHKLKYPLVLAFILAQKIKNGEPVDAFSMGDVSGSGDVLAHGVDVLKIWNEIQKRFGGIEKLQEWMGAYISVEPMKYVGNAGKFSTQTEEMRHAAQILGAVTERFERLLEKVDDPQAFLDFVKKGGIGTFLSQLNGERLARITGLLLWKSEELYNADPSEFAREELYRFVRREVGEVLRKKGYLQQGDALSKNAFNGNRDAEVQFNLLVGEWSEIFHPWVSGESKGGEREKFFQALEWGLNRFDFLFSKTLWGDEENLQQKILEWHEKYEWLFNSVLRLANEMSENGSLRSEQERRLLSRLWRASVGLSDDLWRSKKEEAAKSWLVAEKKNLHPIPDFGRATFVELANVQMFADQSLLSREVSMGETVGAFFERLEYLFSRDTKTRKNSNLKEILGADEDYTAALAIKPLAFILETGEQLKHLAELIGQAVDEIVDWEFSSRKILRQAGEVIYHLNDAYHLVAHKIGVTPDADVRAGLNLAFARLGLEETAGQLRYSVKRALLSSKTEQDPFSSRSRTRPKEGLQRDLFQFMREWHDQLTLWNAPGKDHGDFKVFVGEVGRQLDQLEAAITPQMINWETMPEGLNDLFAGFRLVAYPALNIFRKLQPRRRPLKKGEQHFLHRLVALASGFTVPMMEYHHKRSLILGTEVLPKSLTFDMIATLIGAEIPNADEMLRRMGDREPPVFLPAFGVSLAFSIKDETECNRFGNILLAILKKNKLLNVEDRYPTAKGLTPFQFSLLEFSWKTAVARFPDDVSSGVDVALRQEIAVELDRMAKPLKKDIARFPGGLLDTLFLDDFEECMGDSFEHFFSENTATTVSGGHVEDAGIDPAVSDWIEAAFESLESGQPLSSIQYVTQTAEDLKNRARFQQALEVYQLAFHYFTLGFEDSVATFEMILQEIDTLSVPEGERDAALKAIVEDRIPFWEDQGRDLGFWADRMKFAEKLGPIVLSGRTPQSAKTFLERLAGYANPKEQRFELLPLPVYQRVWTALVVPLAVLHPELMEPGFYDAFMNLAPANLDAAAVYFRAISSLFPHQTKLVDSETDMSEWDISSIELGAMHDRAVERKLVREISEHGSDVDYPEGRAAVLEKVLNAFIRYRINSYIRDVEAKPTDVRYTENELMEIPILHYLFYAVDDREAAEAYAQDVVKGEVLLTEGIEVRGTSLWDYLEGESGAALTPVQEAIFKALLHSENQSEALAKLPLYRELLRMEDLDSRWKSEIFKGMKQSGILSPAMISCFKEAEGDSVEMSALASVFSRMIEINGGETLNDFSFAAARRFYGMREGERFWERYERLQEIFRRGDAEVSHLMQREKSLWSGDSASEWTLPGTLPGKAKIAIGSGAEDQGLHRRFFAEERNGLDLSDPADQSLLPEYLIAFWRLETPRMENIWACSTLQDALGRASRQRRFTFSGKLLQISQIYKVLLNIHKYPQWNAPWISPRLLARKHGRDTASLETYRTMVRQSERHFFETRAKMMERLGGEIPEIFKTLPELPRFFLQEFWAQMKSDERDDRRAKVDLVARDGGGAPEAMLVLLEGEGLEKVGQILHMFFGLVPERWRSPLGKTLEGNRPATLYEIRKTVELELGASLEEVYSEFDEAPTGVGSIAQVHRAVRRDNGREVALKVIVPSRLQKVSQGLKRLRVAIAWYALQHARFQVPIDLVGFFRWFEKSMEPEFNLQLEAENIIAYGEGSAALGGEKSVPGFSADHGGKGLLEMDWVPNGTPPTREEVKGVANLVLSQMFLNGLTHDDPHAGNVRGGVLLDYGRMERVAPELRQQTARFLVTLWMVHDLRGLDRKIFMDEFKKLSEMGGPEEGRKIDSGKWLTLQMEYLQSNEDFFDRPLDGNLLADVIRWGGEAGLVLSPEVYVMMKTLIALDSLGRSVDPEFSLVDSLQPILMTMPRS